MTPFGASLAALVVLWGAFLASPYVAILRTAEAIASRDIPALVERINIYAVRASLVKQMVAAGLSGSDLERFDLGPTGVGGGSVAAALGPVVAEIVTPSRAAGLLAGTDGDPTAPVPGSGTSWPQRLTTLVWSSRWRGFRNVSVALPSGVEPDRQARVQFRLSRLSWRIVAVELPRSARTRLARALAAELGPRR